MPKGSPNHSMEIGHLNMMRLDSSDRFRILYFDRIRWILEYLEVAHQSVSLLVSPEYMCSRAHSQCAKVQISQAIHLFLLVQHALEALHRNKCRRYGCDPLERAWFGRDLSNCRIYIIIEVDNFCTKASNTRLTPGTRNHRQDSGFFPISGSCLPNVDFQ